VVKTSTLMWICGISVDKPRRWRQCKRSPLARLEGRPGAAHQIRLDSRTSSWLPGPSTSPQRAAWLRAQARSEEMVRNRVCRVQLLATAAIVQTTPTMTREHPINKLYLRQQRHSDFRATLQKRASCVWCACERVCVHVSACVSVFVARAIRRSDADRC
jgi:hypothetical protein